ncbi:MAG TPA: hypothetical protein VM344_04670 [Vitreimonas sp.]|nr:hypothetical protein [Vitreimonas sp.]
MAAARVAVVLLRPTNVSAPGGAAQAHPGQNCCFRYLCRSAAARRLRRVQNWQFW